MSAGLDPKYILKELRQITGCGIKDCNDAVKATNCLGDAIKYLQEKNKITTAGRSYNRITTVGRIDSYVHPNGKYASMVRFLCETDFAANSEKFKEFMHNICMHVAATGNSISNLSFWQEDFFEETEIEYLLKQDYIKDESKKINDLVIDISVRLGEKVTISQIKRMVM